MNKTVEKHIQQFLEHCTKLTVRLSTFDTCGSLKGRASGFLYQPNGCKIPLIITAGHKLPTKGSFIESRVQKEGQTLLMNAGEFKVFYNHDEIDYGYSTLPYPLYKEELDAYKDVEFVYYEHVFERAIIGEAYGFCVINDYAEFVKWGDDLYRLPSYYCYEIGMELVKQTEHLNYFKLTREFQGDEYYQGASGSPILSPDGAITSILIGGSEETKLLRAFRPDNIEIPIN